jgi:hypothetical protein
MSFNIEELNKHVSASGIDTPPPVDVKSLIDAMGDQVALQPMAPVGR